MNKEEFTGICKSRSDYFYGLTKVVAWNSAIHSGQFDIGRESFPFLSVEHLPLSDTDNLPEDDLSEVAKKQMKKFNQWRQKDAMDFMKNGEERITATDQDPKREYALMRYCQYLAWLLDWTALIDTDDDSRFRALTAFDYWGRLLSERIFFLFGCWKGEMKISKKNQKGADAQKRKGEDRKNKVRELAELYPNLFTDRKQMGAFRREAMLVADVTTTKAIENYLKDMKAK